MNNITVPAKVLRGEADAAKLAAYRLASEFERKYVKDLVGFKWVMKHLQTINKFLDDIERPLNKTSDLDETMSLVGLVRFNSDTVKRKLDTLIPLYRDLLEQEGKPVPVEFRRIVMAKLVETRKEA